MRGFREFSVLKWRLGAVDRELFEIAEPFGEYVGEGERLIGNRREEIDRRGLQTSVAQVSIQTLDEIVDFPGGQDGHEHVALILHRHDARLAKVLNRLLGLDRLGLIEAGHDQRVDHLLLEQARVEEFRVCVEQTRAREIRDRVAVEFDCPIARADRVTRTASLHVNASYDR